MNKNNLIGMKFGELLVIDKIENHSHKNNRTFVRWVCECSCGNKKECTTSKLISGHIKSCGCLKFKKDDLTNKRINKLTFLYPDKNSKNKWVCKCDCGKLTSVVPSNVKRGLTKSCGCLHSKLISEKFTKNLIGQNFERLTVLSRDNNKPKSSGVYWLCKCNCGNEVSVISHSLINGNTKSCGCLKRELTSELLSLDLLGKKFGKLNVIKRYGTFVGSDETKYSQWLCKCDCGSEKIVKGHDLVRKSVTSCGCIISRAEEKIRILLNHYNVNYKTQYSFTDLKSKKGWVLRFDFAIMDKVDNLICLIEYQGQQHFDDSYGWFGKQQRNETDNLKKQYCEHNNIKLFEITYKDNIEQQINNILLNL